MRKLAPKYRDKFAASPCPDGDMIEFKRAFDLVKEAYPNVELGYIGYDGKGYHYFEKRGEKMAYVVPASDYFKFNYDPKTNTLKYDPKTRTH